MTQLLDASPLWPARLDHIRYDSPDAARLADFYSRTMGMVSSRIGDAEFLLEAPSRTIVIGQAETAAHPYSAFALGSSDQLEAYRAFLLGRGVTLVPSPTPLFGADAFAVRDPDGRLAAFGTGAQPRAAQETGSGAGRLPGLLQHVVVASAQFPAMMKFYTEALGFMLSDTVHKDNGPEAGQVNVCFLRSDEMHHSFAVFQAPKSRADHHAYETTGWNDLKLWADHFGTLEIPIWWGPGRHGAGNNVFFMIRDPDGNNIEISAELETMEKGQPGKKWMGARRATNLWGEPWIRDTAT